ncbi:hypothetical protein PSN01_06003 [Micromonospora saelicesensis]|nr:hypothetical protein PSN01_06003 [Micromonospora saelicesensis]
MERVTGPPPADHCGHRLDTAPSDGARFQHHRRHAVTQQQPPAAGTERADRPVHREGATGVEERELVRLHQVAGRDHHPLDITPADPGGGVGHRRARRHAGAGVDPGVTRESTTGGELTGEHGRRRTEGRACTGGRARTEGRAAVHGEQQGAPGALRAVQTGRPAGRVDRVGQLVGEGSDLGHCGRHCYPAGGGVESAHRSERRHPGQHTGELRVGAPPEGADRVHTGELGDARLNHLRRRSATPGTPPGRRRRCGCRPVRRR